MIDTKAIKNRMLNFAMKGQLTEQLPEDGTAEELYAKISKEKDRLIKEKKIKKDKTVGEISDDEIPFDIPVSWKWVRVGNIAEISSGTTPQSTEVASVGTIPYFKVSDMNILGNETHMNHASSFVSDEYSGKIFPAGTTIFPKNGGAALTNKRRILVVPSAVDLNTGGCTPVIPDMSNWIRLFMDTIDFGKIDTGSNIPTVNATNLKMQLIPLPPVSEQIRIVERIEYIYEILDQIEDLQNQYASNKATLKNKLIDAAIQGKLTEQLPDDGTAELLIHIICDERNKEEKKGIIKKVKPQPPILESDLPFNIPHNWKWVRLGDVSYIVRGGSPRPIKQYITNDANGINWIKIGDVEKGGKYILETKEKIKPEGVKKSRRVYPGDFLLTNSMSFGRPYISKIEGCIHDGWLLIHDLKGFDQEYLYYLLSSRYLYDQFTQKASGSTVDNLNIGKVSSAIIPLPPLAEQKRIATKIRDILNILNYENR